MRSVQVNVLLSKHDNRIAQLQLPDSVDANPHPPPAAARWAGHPCRGELHSLVPGWVARYHAGGELGADRPRMLVYLDAWFRGHLPGGAVCDDIRYIN